jgi:hypothetical protein
MALVMQQYLVLLVQQAQQEQGLAVPRVLGLTASPAVGHSVAATSVKVEALLAALGSAQLVVVDEAMMAAGLLPGGSVVAQVVAKAGRAAGFASPQLEPLLCTNQVGHHYNKGCLSLCGSGAHLRSRQVLDDLA